MTDGSPSFYSPMFIIPKKNGGHHLITNMKKLNTFLTAPHFKIETLPKVIQMIRPNNYITSINVTNAFLHIKIHPASHRFLRVYWNDQHYQFHIAIFGLSLIPWLYTKITKPILTWTCQQGIRVSAYLNNWIIIGKTAHQTHLHTQQLMKKLYQLGWMINSPLTSTSTPRLHNRYYSNDNSTTR